MKIGLHYNFMEIHFLLNSQSLIFKNITLHKNPYFHNYHFKTVFDIVALIVLKLNPQVS